MAAEAEPEAGVVAVAGPGVGHVYQVTVDRDAVGQRAAGGDHTAGHEAEGAIGTGPQHRDLVAARINGDQEPAVRRELQCALRGQPGAGPGPAGRERRPGLGGQRAISVAVKRPDRVGRFGVVVDVDMPDDRGRTVRRRSGGGRGNRDGRGRGQAEH